MGTVRDRVAAYTYDLEFARSAHGTVHVLEPAEDPGNLSEASDAETQAHPSFAEAMADWILRGGPRRLTVCGRTLPIDYTESDPSKGRLVDAFPDEETCGRCIALLGDQSPRAFQHPQTAEEEAPADGYFP